MQSIREYIKGLSKKLIFKVILIFLVTTAVAGAMFYMALLQAPLPGAYGRAIATISLYKLQIIRDGFYIYMLYAAFVMVGVFIISWFYSHRVARPFQKIQGCAREMAKGNFDVEVAFEDNAEVHPLADAINKMARDCKIRNEHLYQRMEALASEAHHFEAALKSGDKKELERVYRSLSARAEEIEEAFSELKL